MKYIGNELELFLNATNWKKYWSSFVEIHESSQALEIGAGIGGNYDFLVNKSGTLTLIEPDSFFCENYLRYFAVDDSRIKVICGKLQNLSSEITFDAIYYIDVLEHIYDDKAELTLAISHLSTNGSIYIVVPAFDFLFSEFDRSVGHFRRYTKKSIKKILPSNCEINKVMYLDALGWLGSAANKILFSDKNATPLKVHFWDHYLIPISKVIDKFINYSIGKSLYIHIKKL
jgi:hypothetical protein